MENPIEYLYASCVQRYDPDAFDDWEEYEPPCEQDPQDDLENWS